MRYSLLLVSAVLLAACSVKADQAVPNTQEAIDTTLNTDVVPTQEVDPTAEPQIELPNLGPAPELTNEVWLNTDQPLPLADLKGKVVLLEMWTFG
jgi:hypothetical protein